LLNDNIKKNKDHNEKIELKVQSHK